MNALLKGFNSYKKPLVLAVFILVFFGSYFFQVYKEESLQKNKKITIGKVLSIDKCIRRRRCIRYDFFVEGIKVNASDILHSGWPEHVREGKPKLGGFYAVEYDASDPKNSKIQIKQKPYSFNQLLQNSLKIEATIDKAMEVSDDYVDFHISYQYKNVDFNFRTRLRKDNMPCENLEYCTGNVIWLNVNKFYPQLNDLFIRSYDRKHLFD